MTIQNRDGRSVVTATQNAACFSAADPFDGADDDSGSGKTA